MKEALLSLVMLTAIVSARSSEIGKDGFNFYKDYLRARSDEVMLEDPSSEERMLYFYRTPLQLYPGLLPAIEQEYRKRTGNVFKNHMLSKDTLSPGDIPAKRSSKTALSMMLQGKQGSFYPTDYQQGDVVEIPVVSS